jgi:NitT/TauT family transport system substrate-binding protein
MKKSLIVSISIIVVLIGGYFVMQKQLSQTPQTTEKLTIAWAPNPTFGLMYVAEEKGYFKEEGLEVTYNKFTTGRDALNDAILKKSDIAMVYEAPVVRRIYEKDPVSIISALHSSSQNAAIVGRKDKGVQNAIDLKGKKVGVAKGTAVEFFFFSYLTSQGVKISDVTLVNGEFTDMITYLRDGKTDAVVTTNPYLFEIQKEFGDSINVFQSEIYTESSLLAGNTEVIKNRPEAFVRLLRALVKSEKLYENSPEEAIQAVIASLPQFSEESIRGTRDAYVPKLKLDNVLLTVLNREAQWFKDNDIYTTELPNFRNFILTDYLKSVKPEVVTLY